VERALKAADILIPDGVGVMLASRILGGGIRRRITGNDIFRELSRRLNDQGGASCFFLGSTEATLAAIEARLAGEFPRIRFADAYSPPFKELFSEEENCAMIAAINGAAPDVKKCYVSVLLKSITSGSWQCMKKLLNLVLVAQVIR
jgi:N-acetylglucosaminyldiphosphoundecaprenol N-acetyl-beta-D-mannosaminyltransferase